MTVAIQLYDRRGHNSMQLEPIEMGDIDPPDDWGPRECRNAACWVPRFWSTDAKPNCPECGTLGVDSEFLAAKRPKVVGR